MCDNEILVAPDEAVGIESGTRDAITVGPVMHPELFLAGEIGKLSEGVRFVDAREIVPVTCKRHSRYRGLRRPQNGCSGCMALYEYARATGVREKRQSRKSKETA